MVLKLGTILNSGKIKAASSEEANRKLIKLLRERLRRRDARLLRLRLQGFKPKLHARSLARTLIPGEGPTTKPSLHKRKVVAQRLREKRGQLARHDIKLLYKLLKDKQVTGSLYNLNQMAMLASRSYQAGDAYEALHDAFCDGVEVCIRGVMPAKVFRSKGILANSLHKRFKKLIVKNILVQARGNQAVLWITFTADSNRLDPRTMFQLRQLQAAVVEHAQLEWGLSEEQAKEVRLNKIDVALDLAGAFLPMHACNAYTKIKNRLKLVLPKVFDVQGGNMISQKRLPALKVCPNRNTLDTCFQYDVRDDEGSHLMTVKFYDKFLDLLGREGSHQVGSRLHTVLGCNRVLSPFQKDISRTSRVGLTRVEISIRSDALRKYSPFLPSFKTRWHVAADSGIKKLAG